MVSGILNGKYKLHETIGTGGFAKVKLATHVVTGEKVAIKIMDKAALGDDLPRVDTELMAMQELCHNNICQLYQVIDSGDKFCIVQEYCPGGELFDYIVMKNRLEESVARGFFRQILSAVSYIHTCGYAHRDLKPENILLGIDDSPKLIDFGLCAKPLGGVAARLHTRCGSPAYAAPELIFGKPYVGAEADIWSLGVLLYALLCGCLPFDDSSMSSLYRKIQSGRYAVPGFLSSGSVRLLADMLQVDPARRISTARLCCHEWIIQDGRGPVCPNPRTDQGFLDEDCINELALYMRRSKVSVEKILSEWKYDSFTTATYLILYQMKRRGEKPRLNVRQRVSNSPVRSILTPIQPRRLDFNNQSKRSETPCKTPINSSHTGDNSEDVWTLDKENATKPSAHIPRIACARNVHRNTPLKALPDSLFPQPRTPFKVKFPARDILPSTADRGGAKFRNPFHSLTRSSSRDRHSSSKRRAASVDSPHSIRDPTPPRVHACRNAAMEGGCRLSPARSIDSSLHAVSQNQPLTPQKSSSMNSHLDESDTFVQGDDFKWKFLGRIADMVTPRRSSSKNRSLIKSLLRKVKMSNNVLVVRKGLDWREMMMSLSKVVETKNLHGVLYGPVLRVEIRNDWGQPQLAFELEAVQISRLVGERRLGVRRKRVCGSSMSYKRMCEEILRDANIAET